MEKPFILIIIPALNEEHFLPNLLESLTKQTSLNFEVIVVDGRSKDKTVEKAQTFVKRLPKLAVVIANHANLPYQRNFGALKAIGDWFVFLDADSVLLPYAVDRMEVFIREEKPAFFTSWTKPDSIVINDVMLALFGNIILEGSILVKRPFSPGPFTAVSRAVFNKVGGYTDGLKWGEDVDFSTKVQKAGHSFSILREILYIWSLRRLRNEGKLNFIQQSVKAAFYVLLTNKALTSGYEMGGHLYKKNKKSRKQTPFKKFTKTLKNFSEEMFK